MRRISGRVAILRLAMRPAAPILSSAGSKDTLAPGSYRRRMFAGGRVAFLV